MKKDTITGDKIYRLRNSKGLTQDSLSESLGVSKTTVWKWEQNLTSPKGENFAKLCVYFNITF